jgi:hypothetical protein
MLNRNFLFFIFIFFSNLLICQSIDLIKNGKSNYVLIIPTNASQSLTIAINEFKECSKIKFNVSFDVLNNADNNFISFGYTKQLFDSKIDTSGLKIDGYKIITQGNNIFIFGKDSSTENKFVNSNGTANGIYEFLEIYYGVRWLMPSKIGRHIPYTTDNLKLDPINIRYNPSFINRDLSKLTAYSNSIQKKNVVEWMNFQKINTAIDIDYNHNWSKIVDKNASTFKQNTDWFALNKGQRVNADLLNFKFETTNKKLVNFVADKAVEELRENKSLYTFSLSPNDGRNWSESDESKKYYDSSVFGRNHHLTTRLVFKWYKDVSELVYKKCPECMLAGYLYSDYLFPTEAMKNSKFPKNFIPVLAMSPNYGYRLYNQNKRKEHEYVLREWKKMEPSNWLYFDMPNHLFLNDIHRNNFPGSSGNITPIGNEILNYLIPMLDTCHFTGVTLYGDPSWSNAAMTNYVMAKLLWNPNLNAKTLQDEWLNNAYGNKTAAFMIQFYELLENNFKLHYTKNELESFKFNEAIAKEVYSKNYKEFYKLITKAKKQKRTEIEEQRFLLIYDNFQILTWRLSNQGLIKTRKKIDNHTAEKILTNQCDDFQKYPNIVPTKRLMDKIPEFKIQVVDSIKKFNTKNSISSESRNCFVIYSPNKRDVTIHFKEVKQGLIIPCYYIKNNMNEVLESGILFSDKKIELKMQANQEIYLFIPHRTKTNMNFEIHDAIQMQGNFKKKEVFIEKNNSLLIQPYSSKGVTIESKNKGVSIFISNENK